MTPQHELEIRTWITALSLRCQPRTTETIEVTAKDYARGLGDLSQEVWCDAAREAASQHFEYFPSYKQLRKFLESWAAKNLRPNHNLLPPVDDPSLSDEDKTLVRSWINNRSKGNLDNALRLYRDKWPKAFRYIVRTDAEAERIARRHGWAEQPEEGEVADSWRGMTEAGIAAKLIEIEKLHKQHAGLAAGALSLLRVAVTRYVPHLAGLVPARFADIIPPEVHRSVDAQLAALRTPEDAANHVRNLETTMRAAGQLPPDVLEAARAADPAVQKARAHQEELRKKPPSTPNPPDLTEQAREVRAVADNVEVIQAWVPRRRKAA